MIEKYGVSSIGKNHLTSKYDYSHNDAYSWLENDLVDPGHSINYHFQFLLFLSDLDDPQ